MRIETGQEITALLHAWSAGDREALESLVPLVNQELRHIAKRRLHGPHPDPILDTSALINEAPIRLTARDCSISTWTTRRPQAGSAA